MKKREECHARRYIRLHGHLEIKIVLVREMLRPTDNYSINLRLILLIYKHCYQIMQLFVHSHIYFTISNFPEFVKKERFYEEEMRKCAHYRVQSLVTCNLGGCSRWGFSAVFSDTPSQLIR